MKTRLLIITSRDPRRDCKVAEAIRIAAGLGSWGEVAVDVALLGPAVRALDAFPEELADGHLIAAHLEAIPEHGGEILVQSGSPLLREIEARVRFCALSKDEILGRNSRYFMTL